MGRFATVYPLVTTRALARPFTYLGDGLEKGTIVSVPFGRTRHRGGVAELAAPPPPPRGGGAALRPALPASALVGEEPPARLTEEQERALDRIVGALGA